MAVTRSRSTDPVRKAGIASTGSTSTTANVREVHGGDRGRGPPLAGALLDQHPVLEGAAQGAARGGDLRERVAGELRVDDGRPGDGVERDPLHVPETGEAERLQRGHPQEPPRVDAVEVLPRREDLDQAGGDEVERDAGDHQPEGRAPEVALGPLGLELSLALELLLLRLGVLGDRVLQAIADRCPLHAVRWHLSSIGAAAG